MGDFIPSGQHSSSAVEHREHEADLFARRVTSIPSNQQVRCAYDGDLLEYVGFAPKGLAEGTYGWMIFYLEYDSSDNFTSKTIATGTWTGRESLTYE